MSYEKYKDVIKQTNEARRSAVRILIENHRDEFDNIYLDEARKVGLNPTKIENKLRKKEEMTNAPTGAEISEQQQV